MSDLAPRLWTIAELNDIRNVYALSSYMRSYNSALAHINRTRVAVQRPLDPAAAGWTDDDVFAEARRLGWS